MSSDVDWVMLGVLSCSSSCGTPTDRVSESGTTSSAGAGSAEATRILLAEPSIQTLAAAPRLGPVDRLVSPGQPYARKRRLPRAVSLRSTSEAGADEAPRRHAPSSLRIAQRIAKLPAHSTGGAPLLQRLVLRRVTTELATAQLAVRRMDRQLSSATSDASGLASQLGQLQRLLHGTRGELERGGYELSMARSLLQQYHRAVEQLLAALAAARAEGPAVEGASQDAAVVTAAQKLKVANLQLEASRYVLDVCQDALAATDPAGGVSLVASVQHTTTSTTMMTTTSDHLQAPAPQQRASSPLPPAFSPVPPSPSPSRTPTPTPPPLALVPLHLPTRAPSSESTTHHHHHHHTVTTTTTTTAVSTHLTLTRPTPAPAPPHPSLGTAQAAWQSYFAAISVALDDPRQHSPRMLPLFLAALTSTIIRNMLHANLAYWAAVAALPRALLPLPFAALRATAAAAAAVGAAGAPAPAAPVCGRGAAAAAAAKRRQQERGGVCEGLAGVAVAYLDYALAMACAGLEILNATTTAWCCVTHSAHVYLASAFAPPAPEPPAAPHPDDEPPARHRSGHRRRRPWPLRAAYAVLAAKGGVLAAAVWGALGLWHLLISVGCVLLGSCNLLASLFAAAVQRCAAGAGHLPPRLVAADLAQPLYQSSARSLALCSLTGLHGCTYFYWAHLALCGACLRAATLPRLLACVAWCPMAACARALGHVLLLVGAAPGDA